MVAADRNINSILHELLSAEGCQINFKPASRYCALNEKVSFRSLCKRAQEKGEVLIGYRRHEKKKGAGGWSPDSEDEYESSSRKSLNPADKYREREGSFWRNHAMVVI